MIGIASGVYEICCKLQQFTKFSLQTRLLN